jgi:hypothetical protein
MHHRSHYHIYTQVWCTFSYIVINMSLIKLRDYSGGRNIHVLYCYIIRTCQCTSNMSGSQGALGCLCVCWLVQLGLRELKTQSQSI